MGFYTKWEQKNAAGEISKVIKQNPGDRIMNIDDEVNTEIDRRGNYSVRAESTSGSWHNTRVDVNFKDDPEKGCYIEVVPKPGSNTSSAEAQQIEEKIKEAYFGDGRIR